MKKRVILIVLDSVGAGALPDAAAYGDAGSNTLGHIYEQEAPSLPRMEAMGLGCIDGMGYPVPTDGAGVYGRSMEASAGKDTTTGHWELMGIKLEKPFPLYPEGFPPEVMDAFEAAIGTKTLGNRPASGTAILDELGEEHIRTGYPIVYTSGDSVFQIACHEELYPPEKLYEMCEKARAILTGEHAVGRVIARPFIGKEKGGFTRTGNRRDFSLEPVARTLLDAMSEKGLFTMGVGKIEDIFCMRGLCKSNHAAGNPACIDATLEAMQQDFTGLLFVNLVDFDSSYGHRRDVKGYADALRYFDGRLGEIMAAMGEDDLLILTADHGCDPAHTGTDHTREYIPILCYHKGMQGRKSIATRRTYADIAATIAENFGLEDRFEAESFLNQLQ
ncbi:MAG: phosphopentomutase [Clostridiales bacterium]|nr:phosphopentomutase [Clostridiales bacterium]